MDGSHHPQQLFATLYPWRERRGGGRGGWKVPRPSLWTVVGHFGASRALPSCISDNSTKEKTSVKQVTKKSSCTLYYTVTLIEFSSWKFFSCGPLLSSCSLVYKHFYSGKTHFIITNMYHSHFINLPLMIFAFGSSLIIALLTIVRALWAYLRIVKKRGNSTIL